VTSREQSAAERARENGRKAAGCLYGQEYGLTKREAFALGAMQALVATYVADQAHVVAGIFADHIDARQSAARIADAVLLGLAETETETGETT